MVQELKKMYKNSNPKASNETLTRAATNHINRQKSLQEAYNNKLLNYVINDLLVTFSDENPKYLILNRELKKKNSSVEKYINSKATGKKNLDVDKVINNIFKDDVGLKQEFDAHINNFLKKPSFRNTPVTNAQLIKKYREIEEGTKKAEENYRNVYGEKEARLVQAIRERRKKNKEEGFAKTVTEQMEKLNMPETKRLTEE